MIFSITIMTGPDSPAIANLDRVKKIAEEVYTSCKIGCDSTLIIDPVLKIEAKAITIRYDAVRRVETNTMEEL